MVTITLPNQNSQSPQSDVTIHLNTGKCTTNDQKDILLEHLVNEFAFHHPLLDETPHQAATNKYHHEYHDLAGLFLSSRHLYSMLLNTKNRSACLLKISPSAAIQGTQNKETRRIHFSTQAHRAAQESITLSQLEALVSDLSGYSFKYIDGLIIDEELTIENLPEAIHGDSLYKSDDQVLALLNTPMDLTRLELRYINPIMGFGLFAREPIKQNELSFIYAGEKTLRPLTNPTYAFERNKDSLNMYLDARQYGNIARFINHAPKTKKNTPQSAASSGLEANLESVHHYVHGIEVVIFSASRDIAAGEQLLVDYGEKFFESAPIRRFKNNNKPVRTPKNWLTIHSQKKLHHFRTMAKHGIMKAQHYLLLRLLMITVVIIVLMLFFLFKTQPFETRATHAPQGERIRGKWLNS